MRTLIPGILIILLSAVFNASVSGEGWIWQNPLPQGNGLADIDFIDENNGWAISGCGGVLRTTDGGETWNLNYVPFESSFNAVDFIDEHTGWIVGGVST